MDAGIASRLAAAFAQGTGTGLLQLGGGEVGRVLPPVFVWWRSFASRYVAGLCLQAPAGEGNGHAALPQIPAPDQAELATLVLTAPMMTGAEYLTEDVLRRCWTELQEAAAAALAAAGTDL